MTINFEKYPCNYCGHIISSKNCLEEHVVKCCGSHGQIFMQNFKTRSPQILQPKFKASPSLDLFSLPIGFPKHSLTFPHQDPTFQTFLPKCEHCGWTARCGTDLIDHKKKVHNDYRNPFEVKF